MWVVCLFQPRRPLPSGDARFANTRSRWERVRLLDEDAPTVHAGAHFADDGPEVDLIRRTARSMPGHVVVDEVERVDAPSKPQLGGDDVTTKAAAGISFLVAAALRHGWTQQDLAETGLGGDPGDGGGRSPRSGLTLAEATLTTPPGDWSDLAARGRPPWESGDWTPPAPGWRPPTWAAPAPIAAVPPDETAAALNPVVHPDDLAAVATTPDPLLTVSTSSAPPPGDDDDLPQPDRKARPPIPEDVRGDLRALVLDLVQKGGGAVPHFNKVNFLVRRANKEREAAGLALWPTLNADEIGDLIASPTPQE